MCFSASASFGAAAVLTAISLATYKEAKLPEQKMFASIPLIFAFQQVAEGFIWLSFSNPDFLIWRQPFTYGFLVFAQVIWPTWIPVSVMIMGNDQKVAKVLKLLSLLGVLVSLYLAYCLFSYPVHAEAANFHIAYYIDLPDNVWRDHGLGYILVTILPPLVTKTKKIWMFGLTVLFSFLISKVFFTEYVVSVWCFFAAITSGIIYYIVYNINRESFRRAIPYASRNRPSPPIR